MHAARTLFHVVAVTQPDTYREMMYSLRPHSVEAVLRLFQLHLRRSVPDLNVFNTRPECIPDFCARFVTAIRRQFPSPGDAFGIQLTCRITKADTQGTLDSKHLRATTTTTTTIDNNDDDDNNQSSSSSSSSSTFNVSKALRYELDIFTNHTQVFELANTHEYATVFTKHYSVQQLLERIPEACVLEKGNPLNKGKNVRGEYKYLKDFDFIIAPDRVLYTSFRKLQSLVQRLDAEHIVGFSDVRYIFQKCGLLSFYFNMTRVAERQLLHDPRSVYANDVLTVVKYQCCTGQPLPLTRDGLVKNEERSPLEILSFEAPKKNYARLCTAHEQQTHPVKTSADKIFFGQQFNEGTGFRFDVMPPPPPPSRKKQF